MAVQVNEAQLCIDYTNGTGMVDLGEKYGINKITVRKILVYNNITLRGKGRPSGAKNRLNREARVKAEELARGPVDTLLEGFTETADVTNSPHVSVPEPEPCVPDNEPESPYKILGD